MPGASLVKPTHKAIVAYYQTLQAYGEHDVEHETALRSAFQNLLAETAKAHQWMLVPEQSTRVGGKLVRPDGTLCDEYNLHRGYWEAKDTDDKLDAEISKKIAKGYLLNNTIFEDTRQAVLFQGKREVQRTDITDPQNLADLLNHFYAYTEPEHEDFEKAVEEFRERVPDLARGLAEKIKAAHQGNPKFQAAFDSFFTLSQAALDPNINQAAVYGDPRKGTGLDSGVFYSRIEPRPLSFLPFLFSRDRARARASRSCGVRVHGRACRRGAYGSCGERRAVFGGVAQMGSVAGAEALADLAKSKTRLWEYLS
jgi:hypothetical protein